MNAVTELGRLEDLPQDYRDTLTEHNLVPLWPSLRAVLPADLPARKTQAVHWPYASLRPLLLKAGDLTPMEKAERRVLVLSNPSHGLEKMQASAAMYLGMQLLLPGEWAPAHKHTPNALRMIVEGGGAYTTVNGEKCPMERGDLIITPTGEWHEHGHDGTEPVVWLDVLDLPLVYYIESSYHVEGQRQTVNTNRLDRVYRGGIVPTPGFVRNDTANPLLRFAWSEARAALVAYEQDNPDESFIQISYVNPETSTDAQNILGFYALMLRPGQTLRLPVRSPAQVLHQIEGRFSVKADDKDFVFENADTCVIPGFTEAVLTNLSTDEPAFIFMADESPLHRKLGLYENRG